MDIEIGEREGDIRVCRIKSKLYTGGIYLEGLGNLDELIVVRFDVGGDGLILVLELILEERGEEDFLVFGVAAESVGGGQEAMGGIDEVGIFGVGGELCGMGIDFLLVSVLLVELEELFHFGKDDLFEGGLLHAGGDIK